ncbi:histidine kinase [Desulfococcaceae bacterium HSG7]|nr:histidine kinase [Desulfococcaceae bacterium HSG7]
MYAKILPPVKFARMSVIKTFLCTAGFNVLIGLFLTSMNIGGNLTANLINSQCVGLSMCLAVCLSLFLVKPATVIMQVLLAATSIIREKLMATQALVKDERIKRLIVEKKMVESDLKRLQAQIEPHFLFNTLAAILSLLETDTVGGRAMLKDLTQYLRANLSKTRCDYATLGQEIEMITAYINIFKNRMGDRLCYSVHIPESVKTIQFPSMLLQPLVEIVKN